MESINKQLYNDISKMYPYGEFPTHYTKKQKDSDINNSHIFNYYTKEKFEEQNKETKTPESTTINHEQKNNLDFKNILPILTTLSSGKKLEGKELMSSILPLVAGNRAKDLGAIFQLFNNKQKHQTQEESYIHQSLPPSKYNSIDSYERV